MQKSINFERCTHIEHLLKINTEKMMEKSHIFVQKDDKIPEQQPNSPSKSSSKISSSSDEEEEETFSKFPEYIETYLEFDQEKIGPMNFLNFIDNIDIMKYIVKLSASKFACSE